MSSISSIHVGKYAKYIDSISTYPVHFSEVNSEWLQPLLHGQQDTLCAVCVKKNRQELSAVASMRPTEALASVKFWRISPIIFILHKRSSGIFNASWYYKEFSNSVNILWKNYHIIDLKGLRTLTQIFFEQILIKTIGQVNGHPDYVASFWLLLFKFHLN